jgi:BlaI family transcriptional regulator, penicillinase repressor
MLMGKHHQPDALGHQPDALGRRERQIMDAVVRRGHATVAEVRQDLPDPPSYSAVRGMLRLLEEKGFLRHEWEGPRYVYVPTADPEQIRHSAMQHLLHTFFNNSMESAVAAMLGAGERAPTDEELERMAALIDKARRRRKRS